MKVIIHNKEDKTILIFCIKFLNLPSKFYPKLHIFNLDNTLDEGVPSTLDQLRANKSVKSVEELEADIKQMVGISGQMNDSQLSRNDPIPNTDVHDSERQFNNKPAAMMNKDNTNIQAQTEDMSAFKKFVSTKISNSYQL